MVAIDAATTGSLVISQEIIKVSAVPTALQEKAFAADLPLVTFKSPALFSSEWQI